MEHKALNLAVLGSNPSASTITMTTPTKYGLYKVILDEGPFKDRIAVYDCKYKYPSWRMVRGWPAFKYLNKHIISWEYIGDAG